MLKSVGVVLKSVLKFILLVIWYVDILNFPAFEFMDTIVPINSLGWVLLIIIYCTVFKSNDSNNIACNDCVYKDTYFTSKNSYNNSNSSNSKGNIKPVVADVSFRFSDKDVL